jgi:hypothetical protein
VARIRCIKPEFPHSESMGRVSRDARLTFIQLWTIADDSGRLRGNSRMLASLLFPYDDDAKGLIDGWLAELEREHCIQRYQIEGTSYVQVCNWLTHQKIDKPSQSKIPPFVESSRILANPRERSSEDLRIGSGSGRDQGEEGKGSPSASATPACTQVSRVAVPPDWMLDFKLAYPDRAGDQGWRKAERAANARIAEGHTPAEFIAGAKRYASFCQSTEKTGSEFVQQAATFLGPGKPFLLPWHAPPKVEQLSPVERVLRANGGVKNDERVVAEQFGSSNAGVGVLDGDVRDAPYAGFRRIGS